MSRSSLADVTVSLSISSTVLVDYRFLAATLSTFSRRRDCPSRPRRLVMSDTRVLRICRLARCLGSDGDDVLLSCVLLS